jgi:hypothetical protein
MAIEIDPSRRIFDCARAAAWVAVPVSANRR